MFSQSVSMQPAQTNRVLANAFKVLTAMMGTTALASFVSMALGAGSGVSLVCSLLGLGLILALSFGYQKMSSTTALGLVFLFSLLEGFGLGGLLNKVLATSHGSAALFYASTLTAAATATCYMVAKSSKANFSRMGGFLFAGLIILLLASILAIFFPSPVFVMVLSAMGALIFTGYMLMDMQAVIRGEQTDYIWAALSIYIDIMGLFKNLLSLFSVLGSSDD